MWIYRKPDSLRRFVVLHSINIAINLYLKLDAKQGFYGVACLQTSSLQKIATLSSYNIPAAVIAQIKKESFTNKKGMKPTNRAL